MVTWAARSVARAQRVLGEIYILTDSPFVFEMGGGTLDFGEDTKAKVDHFHRDAWRRWVFRLFENRTQRHARTDLVDIDTKTLLMFQERYTGKPDRALAWRCCVAREPGHDRLSHLRQDTPRLCEVRQVRHAADHYQWRCPATRRAREAKHPPPAICQDRGLAADERCMLMNNGWHSAA